MHIVLWEICPSFCTCTLCYGKVIQCSLCAHCVTGKLSKALYMHMVLWEMNSMLYNYVHIVLWESNLRLCTCTLCYGKFVQVSVHAHCVTGKLSKVLYMHMVLWEMNSMLYNYVHIVLWESFPWSCTCTNVLIVIG